MHSAALKRFPRVFLSWFLSLVIAPALLLLIAEMTLRAVGVGKDNSPFREKHINGQRFLALNEDYFEQFFTELPEGDIDWDDAETVIPVKKEEGTLRLFVFGSSDAYGVPDPAFSFSRFLRTMLQQQYPKVKFEIYNICYPAINSHVIIPLVRACTTLQPDLFILYSGNNEAIGPYGPLTRLGASPWGNRSLIKADIALKRSRIGQLARGRSALLQKHPRVAPSMFFRRFMPLIKSDDPALATMYDRFRENVSEICDIAKAEEVPLVVCTLACNLRDSRPGIPCHKEGIAPDLLAKWQEHYERGIVLQQKGAIAEALSEYQYALEIDDSYGLLSYFVGHCYLQKREYDKAKAHFLDAVEKDLLRLRLSPKINAIVARLAEGREASGIFLADTARSVEESTSDGIPGSESFYDGVHPTSAANYQIAKAILCKIPTAIPKCGESAIGGAPLPEKDCYDRLGLTPACLLRLHGDVDALPSPRLPADAIPRERQVYFTFQRWREDLLEAAKPDRLRAETDGYLKALPEATDDYFLMARLVKNLLSIGPEDDCLHYARRLVEAFPHKCASRRLLAAALDKSKDYEEALEVLRENTALHPDDARTLHQMALTFVNLGRLDEACYLVRKASSAAPNEPVIRQSEADILVRMGKKQEAADALEDAVAYLPDCLWIYLQLQSLYRDLHGSEGRLQQWRALTVRYPNAPAVYYALAQACAEEGDVQGAAEANSNLKALCEDFGALQSSKETCRAYELQEKGDTAGAMQAYAKAIELDPACFCASAGQGALLEEAGKYEDSLSRYEASIHAAPEYLPPYEGIDRVCGKLERGRRLDVWLRIAQTHPESGAAFLHLGLALEEQGNVEEARKAFANALQLAPEDPAIQAYASKVQR